VVADEVSARRGDQRGQPAQEFARLEHQHLGPGAVPAEVRETLAILRVEVHAGVQREPLFVGSPFLLLARISWPSSERAHRVGLRGGERVRVPCVAVGGVRSRSQEFAHAAGDAPQHVPDLIFRRARQGDETDALFLFDKDAVRNAAVVVHVEVERTAEPLHEGDCAGSRRRRASPAVPVARLEGVEPPARGFEVGAQRLLEDPDASQSLTFRGVTASAISPNVPTHPANHGEFAALVLHDFVSPKEAAARLRVHAETIYRLCARGVLPHVRVGSALRIDLAGYLAGS